MNIISTNYKRYIFLYHQLKHKKERIEYFKFHFLVRNNSNSLELLATSLVSD